MWEDWNSESWGLGLNPGGAEKGIFVSLDALGRVDDDGWGPRGRGLEHSPRTLESPGRTGAAGTTVVLGEPVHRAGPGSRCPRLSCSQGPGLGEGCCLPLRMPGADSPPRPWRERGSAGTWTRLLASRAGDGRVLLCPPHLWAFAVAAGNTN